MMALTLAQIEACKAVMERAQACSHPCISRYRVGVSALGLSGTAYPGCNIEFAGEHLNHTVHGEQTVLANAWAHGERAVVALFTSAAPCGHCRQFINELANAAGVAVYDLSRGTVPASIAELLPHAFGPRDLGLAGGFMAAPYPHRPGLPVGDPAALAREAAAASYAPYSGSCSGVCLVWPDGRACTGALVENAAFNPTLAPAHMAFAVAAANGLDPAAVSGCWLAEGAAGSSYQNSTLAALRAMAPRAAFERIALAA